MDELLPPTLLPNTRVQVRCRFDGSWVTGFEIASASAGSPRYHLRRVSDGVELPAGFSEDDVRPA